MRVARFVYCFSCSLSLLLLSLILWQPAAAQGYKCNGTCEPDSSSTTYQQTVATRTLVQNQRSVGPSPIPHANSTTQAANPRSTTSTYAIPIIHFPTPT